MIVATAGHVDHGKTALVRALTGVDTDRLPEEKRRGMSIDLGFAYLALGGRTLAFVDVPGHERFVRNMTAGVHGIDLALLVVAADDGPMPQTREHLAILELLGAPRLLAVLSKTDRVPPGRVAEAAGEVHELLAASRFAGAEVLPLSSRTGEGLEALKARLEALAAEIPPRRSAQRFRMPVDRAFVKDGLGLVVTGTVVSGSVRAGDAVQLLPAGRRARVRSLRANSGEAALASAGERCALALHGIARGEARRGCIVADAAPAPASRRIDVLLEPLAGAGVRRGIVGVQMGTAHLGARLAPFGRFARLVFPREVSCWHGDRLLVRDPGPRRLVAAGTVLDPSPPERGASRLQRVAFLEALAGRDAGGALGALLDRDAGIVDTEWLARAFHLPAAELERLESAHALTAFIQRGARHVMRAARWRALCDAAEQAVAAWHAAQPDSIGPRPAEIGAPLPAVVEALVEAGRLVREGPRLRRPAHRPVLSARDEALWQRVAPLLAGEGARPPRVHELAARLAIEPKTLEAFLQRSTRAGRVHRVAPNRFFLPETIETLAGLARELDAESGSGGFAAAAYRDRSGLGRNLAIEVLEYLDRAGYTRRVGDLRLARPRAGTPA